MRTNSRKIWACGQMNYGCYGLFRTTHHKIELASGPVCSKMSNQYMHSVSQIGKNFHFVWCWSLLDIMEKHYKGLCSATDMFVNRHFTEKNTITVAVSCGSQYMDSDVGTVRFTQACCWTIWPAQKTNFFIKWPQPAAAGSLYSLATFINSLTKQERHFSKHDSYLPAKVASRELIKIAATAYIYQH